MRATPTLDPPALDPDEALRTQFGLADDVLDDRVLANTVQRLRERRVVLPTFAELADPRSVPETRVGDADPQAADPRNLWRVHWYNDRSGGRVDVPDHVVLTRELTGIDSPVLVVLGNRFPMIASHKVLAAYGCLAPRVVTGQFDPTVHRAIWPSTGNYARGDIAVSRLLACRGVAVLPTGMSQERFDWLDRWCENPAEDVIRTVGTESNVKEIYDECNRLASEDAGNFVFNQFAEFGNHLVHYAVTGPALAHVFETYRRGAGRDLRLALMASATGSAGTIAAGEHLKDVYGTKVLAAEALECPTLLQNGFGEHNIQGIGDKHVPLIHNVMRHDLVAAVSDRATDHLEVMVNEPEGLAYLAGRGVPPGILDALRDFGFSSICNVLAAISGAKVLGLGPDDVVVTVATDGGELYVSERAKVLSRDFGGEFTRHDAAAVWGEHLANVPTDATLELTHRERTRIFNLGYYTWVEQQGTPIELFERRRHQDFWRGLRAYLPRWDELITDVNARVAG